MGPTGSLSEKRIDGIQVWRALAATSIVCLHVFLRLDYIAGARDRDFTIGKYFDLFFLEAGVDAFFLISGFIMVYITEIKKNQSVGKFLVKRMLRIYPSYWFCSALMILVLMLCLPKDPRLDFSYIEFFLAFALFPTYNDISNSIFPKFLDVGWTLMYELVFYAVFSLFINQSFKIKIFGTSLLLCSLHVFAIYTNLLPRGLDWLLSDSVLMEFVLGMIVGWIFLTNKEKAENWLLVCVSLVAVGMFTVLQYFPYDGWGQRLVNYAVPLSCLLWVTLMRKSVSWTAPKVLAILGDSSYSIYLTHMILIVCVGRSNRGAGPLAGVSLDLQFFVLVVFCVTFGVATHFVVERPLLRLGKKIVSAQRL